MSTELHSTRAKSAIRWIRSHPEILIFSGLLLLLNFTLLGGRPCRSLMFAPGAVAQGEWWRVLTHPFVHVTWYHLLLDGSAFFLLYPSLLEPRLLKRLAYVCGAVGGSLVLSWVSPASSSGLCGLSGIAHGLMAISALEMISASAPRSPERRIGVASLSFLVAKAGFEAITGRMFFAFLDFGMLGHPVAVAHAGGIMGALVIFGLLKFKSAAAVRATTARRGPGSSGGNRKRSSDSPCRCRPHAGLCKGVKTRRVRTSPPYVLGFACGLPARQRAALRSGGEMREQALALPCPSGSFIGMR